MQLQEFINEHNGKYYNYPGSTPVNQCVSVAKGWASANGKRVIKGNASAWKKAAGYTWVNNSPSAIPSPGDIVVFNIGVYGHVAVAQTSNAKDLTSFDQNYPTGSPCKTVVHRNYAGVAGWLKVGSGSPTGPKTATVTKTMNVRSQPNTTSTVTSVLHSGDVFKYDTVVDGQSVGGNNKWVRSLKGHYVHTSGLKL